MIFPGLRVSRFGILCVVTLAKAVIFLFSEQICGDRMCPINRFRPSPRKNNLILKKVSTEDTGYYKCVAHVSNNSNPAKTSLYLNVLSMYSHNTNGLCLVAYPLVYKAVR